MIKCRILGAHVKRMVGYGKTLGEEKSLIKQCHHVFSPIALLVSKLTGTQEEYLYYPLRGLW